MAKLANKTLVLKNVTIYSVYLLLIWAFYRFLFQFPDNIEELLIKPVLWLLPLFYFVRKEGFEFGSLGLTLKNLFPAIYLSIGLGAIFVMEGILINFLKYGNLHFAANLGKGPFMATLALSFVTAFSEETAFRGYIFSRLALVFKNELTANVIQSVLWTAIHIPIAFFVWGYTFTQGLVYLMITAIFGLGSAFVFSRTKNIFGSIILHVLWEWPIILFR